jgi:hypothetical protein
MAEDGSQKDLTDATTRTTPEEVLLRALYRIFFARDPDPTGLRDYLQRLREGQGIEDVMRSCLTSDEFGARCRDFLRTYVGPKFLATVDRVEVPAPPPDAAMAGDDRGAPVLQEEPRVAAFTPEQARWLESLSLGLDQVLLAQYRPEPGSRPTIYVRDPSRLPRPRGPQSVVYLYELISKYLLHQDYYDRHIDRFPVDGSDLFCIVQIGDESNDVPTTVGYCARGQQVTLIPDVRFWVQRGYFADRQQFRRQWVPWEDRASQVLWRGSTTGAADSPITSQSIQRLPRFQLCKLATNGAGLEGVLDAKLTDFGQTRDPEEREKIRALLEQLGVFSPPVPQTEFLKYRYQIDIDGNSNSWSFLLKLSMGSCVLKVASEWRQWYYDGLRPWEHYVPVSGDLSDLEERVRWCLDNDEAARDIGANGLKFASGIVFGTEMPRAAARVLATSRASIEEFHQSAAKLPATATAAAGHGRR